MSTLRARQLIASKLTIPTLPVVLERITALIQDPNSGAGEVGAVVAEDASLTAKVLKIATSTYYGLREPCFLPQQAASVLGLRVLQNVVRQAAVIAQYDHLKGGAFDVDELWRHSILTGQACKFLRQRSTKTFGLEAEEIYVCGLLHDIGQLVLIDSMREGYVELVQAAEREGLPLHAVEERELGCSHAHVGGLVAQQWGLPPQIANTIQSHHGPREAVKCDVLASLVYNVNLIVHRVSEGHSAGAAEVIDHESAAFLGVDPRKVHELIEFIEQSLTSAEA